MDQDPNEMIIDAMPTKALFVEMLTRDIVLIPAIMDLVDNCCDGAKRERGEKSLTGLWVRLEISPSEFRIADNCGGFSVDTARKFAFRFGRAPGAPTVAHSVGQFGVGMKRALFKLGKKFEVESKTDSSHFVVDEDVDEWVKDPKRWEFKFDKVEDGLKNIPREEQGTTISVTRLRDDVSRAFGPGNFLSMLKSALQSRFQTPLARGLSVTLNQIPINSEPLKMFTNKLIAPAYFEQTYPKNEKKPVRVKIYCGLGDSTVTPAAGWHVFCNGRLILEGDKSSVTGWGEKGETTIPQYHPHLNYFRGYVYFDSDDAGKLPWNTTKTGLNTDSPIYRSVLQDMIRLMRPVIDFLNRLSTEKTEKPEGTQSPLEKIIADSKLEPIDSATVRDFFEMPKTAMPRIPSGPPMQTISPYARPLDHANKVKKKLGATSWRAVGEKTFDYFFKAECGE